jgi:hypothetical protein
MKQAMIVLTLWILSQDAHSQSVKLEGYSHGDAVCASAKHPNMLINRQTMADLDPYSLPAQTEALATASRSKVRPVVAVEKAAPEEIRALRATAKALEDNTRALEENTKALKENTEMMRMLLSGKYHYVGSFAAQQTTEQRYESIVALADQTGSYLPTFSDVPLATNSVELQSIAVAKPQALLASTNSRPTAAKTVAFAMEPTKKSTSNNTIANHNVPAATPEKIKKPQPTPASIAINTPSRPSAIPVTDPKIGVKPHICFLNASSDIPETEIEPSSSAKTQPSPRVWAANISIKTQAPKGMKLTASPKIQVVNAAVKTPVHTKALTTTTSNLITHSKALAANTAAKPQISKATTQTQAPKAPIASIVTKTQEYKNLLAKTTTNSVTKPNILAANTTAKQQAPMAIATIAPPKMPLASSMTKVPKLTSLPANPMLASAMVNPKPGINASLKPHISTPAASTAIPKVAAVTTGAKKAEHSKLDSNPVSVKAINSPKISATITSLKPQAPTISTKIDAAKPVKTYASTMSVQTAMAPVIITASRSRATAAGYGYEGNPTMANVSAVANSFMSVAADRGAGSRGKKVSLGYLLRFPLLNPAYDNQVRMSNHVPTDAYSGFKEGDLVTTHGYISLIAIEDSGTKNETYYIQLVVNPYRKDSCLNVRITANQFAGDDRKRLTEGARQFVRQQLLNGNAPSRSGNVMQSPVYVCITGHLVYNSALAGAMRGPHPLYIGKKGVRSYTPWEISNVNRIQFTR